MIGSKQIFIRKQGWGEEKMNIRRCIELTAVCCGCLFLMTNPEKVMADGGTETPSFYMAEGKESDEERTDQRSLITPVEEEIVSIPAESENEQETADDLQDVSSNEQVTSAEKTDAAAANGTDAPDTDVLHTDETEVETPDADNNTDASQTEGTEVNVPNTAQKADAALDGSTEVKAADAAEIEVDAADVSADQTDTVADSPYKQTIQDGTYIIMSDVSGFKALDVSGGSTADGANVQLYDANGTKAQKFTLTWNADAHSYAITNVNSGKKLTVAGNSKASGANLVQSSDNGSDGQGWYIVQNGGSYSIISALSGMAVDICGAASANGTNAWLYTPNSSKAQLFRFLTSSDTYVNFTDGVYTFASAVDSSKYLDISAASMSSGGNLQIYGGNGTAAQKFILTSAGGNTWRVTSLNSGMSMDLNGAGKQSGTNVRQYYNNDSAGQRWYIRNTGDGTCYFVPVAAQDNALDVAGGSAKNGTNVQSYQKNGTAAQKFIAKKVNYTSPVSGEYVIVNTKSGRALDVKNGSRKMEANVQLYDQNSTLAQKFIVHDLGNGFVTIENANSRHYLDVTGGSSANAANVQQYRNNGTMAQRWIIHTNADGTFSFVNAKSSKALDIANGATGNGANVQQYDYNGSGAQLFSLTRVSYVVNDAAVDYSVEVTVRDLYPEACARLDRTGWNLHSALNDCAAMRYVSTSYTLNAQNVHTIAKYGFATRGGDCYVMACSFYEMARALGYDAHVMFGYVPLRTGGMGPHAWVEIDNFAGSGTRVFDPDFQHESKNNGYNIYYGQGGTWRYTNGRRVN